MINKIPTPILRFAMWLGNVWPWFGRWLNAFAINSLVNACRHRPHPWSTAHDYVSWTSLSDQHFSARHLPPKPATTELPSPDVLIGLFKQPEGEQELSDKSTCLFPAFAQYLTDGFIRTRVPGAGEPEEFRKQNTSNHQIDMCPLYGRLSTQTDALRLKSQDSGRRGRLKSQTLDGEEYAPFLFDGEQIKPEFEPLDPPLGLSQIMAIIPDPSDLRSRIFAHGGDRTNASPQVAMMNTLFLREHNRLAHEIETENPAWDDERVFQTARNTVIVVFIKVVVGEYINHISPSFQFQTDPRVAWNARWNKPNWMTTEFSLLYRWHSLIPNTIVWGGEPVPLMLTLMNNGLLLNGGLANAFADMSGQAAGRLGAFNTPDPILHLERAAIQQGRLCSLAPYTDYCNFVRLPRPATFNDISTDPKVVDFLADHYENANDVEFYAGLFAQDPMKNSPLPPLLLAMVAVDAFSQALTNPLLSEHVFNAETFSGPGWNAIQNTNTLRDILIRNSPTEIGDRRIGMTQSNWSPS